MPQGLRESSPHPRPQERGDGFRCSSNKLRKELTMSVNAFGLFFLAVLLGSSYFLLRCITANRALILAVLRGDPTDAPEEREVTVQACRSPALQPVAISICRI